MLEESLDSAVQETLVNLILCARELRKQVISEHANEQQEKRAVQIRVIKHICKVRPTA